MHSFAKHLIIWSCWFEDQLQMALSQRVLEKTKITRKIFNENIYSSLFLTKGREKQLGNLPDAMTPTCHPSVLPMRRSSCQSFSSPSFFIIWEYETKYWENDRTKTWTATSFLVFWEWRLFMVVSWCPATSFLVFREWRLFMVVLWCQEPAKRTSHS
jgi:hypothetical protein